MTTSTTAPGRPAGREFAAGLVLLATVCLSLALATFSGTDASLNSVAVPAAPAPQNWLGRIGASGADLILQAVGFAGWLLVAFGLQSAYLLHRGRPAGWTRRRLLLVGLLVLACAALAAYFSELVTLGGQQLPTGGLLGLLVARSARTYLGDFGGAFVLANVAALAALTLFELSPVALVQACWRAAAKGALRLRRPAAPVVPQPTEPFRAAPLDPGAAVSGGFTPPLRSLTAEATNYRPLLELLDPVPTAPGPEAACLEAQAQQLVQKLADFQVTGRVTAITPGPVITVFEFEPGAGVKVGRIASLADDLAMALSAQAVRIIAPIPGKGVVGIEIPNARRATVALRTLLASPAFTMTRAQLPLALGTDVAGQPFVADLARMPHLLIAGATGSGKSVAVNAMLLSLLYTCSPTDLKLVLIDPKMLELSAYDGIPHLLHPVVTAPKQAVAALKWGVREMERRYRLLAELGVRNVTSYNEQLARDGAPAGAEFEHAHLPALVIVIDELADLMLVAGRELEEAIARLAQMARAAGIHLVVATQRPSVDVITGLIKANFPARMAFQVSSKTDSRTILDANGAEALLGAGDLLFLPPGTARLVRLHGAFVADGEVQRVTEALRGHGTPCYDASVIVDVGADEPAGDDVSDAQADPCYPDALALVLEVGQASTSMLQRRLRIGYNRAARIIESMEKSGLVGPADGTSRLRMVHRGAAGPRP